ncbi:sensor histidine kinase [Streptomyces sp. NPDC058701]|uniref:sensor histidine kinase n=1 Tax=Streptomyces sp. NPDC058701 TaxID=3346608 RepID=UPI00365D667E
MGEQRARLGSPWRRWVERAGRGPAWRSALFVAVFAQFEAGWAGQAQPDRVPLDWIGRLLLLFGPALLLVRHRYPGAVAYGVAVVTLAYLGAGFPYGPAFLSLAVACFAAVVAGHRRAAWGAVGLTWAGHLLIGHWLYRWLPPPRDGPTPWAQEVGVTGWIVAVLAVFELVRVRREQWSRERAERAAAERRQVDEERLRIARELHDVLAHSISVINVQAGVGLALLDTAPEQARTALTTITAASREALGEVRQVLDTLRAPGEAPRTPAPGLDRLPELVEQAAAAGLTVEVSSGGTARALPPGVDLAVFRIVQEALTNVVRHSGARTARVRLTWQGRALTVRVEDDGPSSGGPGDGSPDGSGSGLVGMRERATALGGTLVAGPRAEGGHAVSVTLPLEPATSREDSWPPA